MNFSCGSARLLCLFLSFLLASMAAQDMPLPEARECDWDMECEELYQTRSSKCLLDIGRCSNPFQAGCRRYKYRMEHTWQGDWNKEGEEHDKQEPEKRTCNSNDDNNNGNDSFCQRHPLQYPEVRIHNGDWESPIFYSWIIQIFLSEFLQVPVTVGLSPEDTAASSFYRPVPEMSWSTQAYAFEEVKTANSMHGRCDLTDKPCVHVMPEVWIGQEKKWKEYLSEGHIDPVNGGGQVGKISWYIPVYTAKRYPQMTSFHGMSGSRQELASIFKRPTSWGEYCAEISTSKCMFPDQVAQRPPEGEVEEAMYFQEGDYTGYFRATDKNDCNIDGNVTLSSSCTGHIVGAPCTWSTNIDAQAYWNDIALESDGPLEENNGYSYGHMVQIWRAANATKSDIVMWWWTPDATVEEFRGTDFEFQPVLLPEPTAKCRMARIPPEDRCSQDANVRRGQNALGGCDNEANSLQKVVAASLRDITYNTPEVYRSPGYHAILNLKVNHLDMNTMLQKWVAGGRSGYAARAAVCDWIVEHEEELETYIPRGYPRTFMDDTLYASPLTYVAIGMGGCAVLYVLGVAVLVYIYMETKVFVYAQVPFMAQLLLGLLLVAIAGIIYALEPQHLVCVSQVWFLTLGYTLELVPLLVKIAAINRMIAATRRMVRVKVSMQSLFLTVAGLVFLVVVFLSVWTALDKPERYEGRYLLEENGSDIVTTVVCASRSSIWELIVLCWNGILIVCATVLAFQSRTMEAEFNESRSLGTMIYSHFVFGVLRAVAFNLNGSASGLGEESGRVPAIAPSTLAAVSSFLLSIDVVTSLTIYVLPKIAAARKSPQTHYPSETGQSDATSHRPTSKKSSDTPGMPKTLQGTGDDHAPKSGPFASSSHRRVSMVGNVNTDEQDDDFSSEAEYEGPRFGSFSNRTSLLGQSKVSPMDLDIGMMRISEGQEPFDT